MTIQIAAARRVADTKREAADQSLQAAEHTGRQTLSELDSMLAVLRGADASIGAAAWPSPADVSSGNRPSTSGNGRPRAPLPRLSDIPALVTHLQEAGRTVTLKLRFADFSTITRAHTDDPTQDGLAIYRRVESLFDRVRLRQAVRLIGLSVSGLGPAGAGQLSLLAPDAVRRERLARAVDPRPGHLAA